MDGEITNARLAVQRIGNDLLQVGLAGDWITRSHLPSFDPVDKGFAAGRVKALEFETASLGRWNSGLMTFILKCYDLCKQSNAEFRAQTLPAGVAKLLKLSQAVPEKKDAARGAEKPLFFQRLGQAVVTRSGGVMAALTFVGDNILAFLKLLRAKAQFRWADALLVMQECGPRALGSVALIKKLIGLILAIIGATQ